MEPRPLVVVLLLPLLAWFSFRGRRRAAAAAPVLRGHAGRFAAQGAVWTRFRDDDEVRVERRLSRMRFRRPWGGWKAGFALSLSGRVVVAAVAVARCKFLPLSNEAVSFTQPLSNSFSVVTQPSAGPMPVTLWWRETSVLCVSQPRPMILPEKPFVALRPRSKTKGMTSKTKKRPSSIYCPHPFFRQTRLLPPVAPPPP